MTEKRFNSYCDNENIRIRIDDENKEIFHIYFAELEDALYCKSKLNPLLDVLNNLAEKNKELKQRNDRQAKRLAELYELMAKKDWETLTEIIDDFCSCEEQLQREWGTYR